MYTTTVVQSELLPDKSPYFFPCGWNANDNSVNQFSRLWAIVLAYSTFFVEFINHFPYRSSKDAEYVHFTLTISDSSSGDSLVISSYPHLAHAPQVMDTIP